MSLNPDSFTINAPGTNKKDVVVIKDGVEYRISPGKRTQIVEIEIVEESKSQHSKQNFQGNTPVVIFGSAHLDVSTIDIGSLRIEDLAMRVKEKRTIFPPSSMLIMINTLTWLLCLTILANFCTKITAAMLRSKAIYQMAPL